MNNTAMTMVIVSESSSGFVPDDERGVVIV